MSTRSDPTAFPRTKPGAPVAGDVIPLSEPKLGGNEWRYVKECLDANWISSAGAFVDRFEEEMAAYVGAGHAVATVNGTAALHVALLVAGVDPMDEVLVPALTFIAPANAVRYAGAWPVFMDADPVYWQMDPEKVAGFLDGECRWEKGHMVNKSTGRRVRAILPVHILGHPCDMNPILELAQKYELRVIEDATESLGARYDGRTVGNLGDIACFSFNGNKTITSGGGGMIVTDNESWAARARYLTTQAKDDPVEYIHNEIGYNYRLTNVQAALGVAQLEQLDGHLASKRRTASAYAERLSRVPGIGLMREAPWAYHAFWLYTVLVDERAFGMHRRQLMSRLHGTGIQTRPLWQPIHQSGAHKGSQAYRLETAEWLYERGLSLPSSAGITPDQVNRVVSAIEGAAVSR